MGQNSEFHFEISKKVILFTDNFDRNLVWMTQNMVKIISTSQFTMGVHPSLI
uniref:Uncharacterized protein n=1 Tax=Lepeophtheirus salmonis TaxID=72036 RepID=A0A0K2UVI4_LEPSM